jgi:hypothetical protein
MCDVEVARQEWETHFASTNSQAAAESLPSIVHAAANAVVDPRVCFVQEKCSPASQLRMQRKCRL